MVIKIIIISNNKIKGIIIIIMIVILIIKNVNLNVKIASIL